MKSSFPSPAKPELLAPAGDWECAHAAVENGADAIYFGVDRFNARMRAKNFTLAELPELMAWLHERGVHGYITFNTLVFTEELQSAEEALRSIIAAGADAVIVQDVGIMRMIRQISPDFPINASTQMSITSAEGILFAEKMGAYVTALGRECSIQEIQRIQQERISQSTGSQQNIFPLEVFIHGALCVSCSGQCLASQALGGRSANRGECAQPCRLPYQLILNGKEFPLGARKFLLSPKDLLGLEMIPDLIQAGVSIFKIEGRLKSPEYVSSISRIYRQAIDAAWDTLSHNNFAPMTCRETLAGILKEKRYELEMTFSRGLGTGWMKGIDQQSLCHARYSGNKGFHIGKVTKIQRKSVYVRTQEPAHPGDGIAFANPETEETVQGGRVYQVDQKGDTVLLEFSRQTFDPQKV
ncbi:MAG: U32 family peptidase, partial [Verrucomicrobia bacterium]|nr:U32 family peptidase [Verrucomicrobiota bacterium]